MMMIMSIMIISRPIHVATNGIVPFFLRLSSISLCVCVCIYIQENISQLLSAGAMKGRVWRMEGTKETDKLTKGLDLFPTLNLQFPS